jgi:hypothetical protein
MLLEVNENNYAMSVSELVLGSASTALLIELARARSIRALRQRGFLKLSHQRQGESVMKLFGFAGFVTIALLASALPTLAQHNQSNMQGMDMPMKHTEKMPPESALKPAEGASVKILNPKAGELIKGDSVALQFKMTKGKRGNHVHAYVDGELMGMFESEKGTLTGVKPGKHTLVLRVVTADHNTELNATDKVTFMTK